MGRTNEALWERAKAEAKRKMGGKHSARAMQLAGKIYREKGGGYTGEKTKEQKSMTKWTKEDWGTKSGKNSTIGDKPTGERYLPRKAREALSSKEYAATTRAKREGTNSRKTVCEAAQKDCLENCKIQEIMYDKTSYIKRKV
jgi:hypothetical protein